MILALVILIVVAVLFCYFPCRAAGMADRRKLPLWLLSALLATNALAQGGSLQLSWNPSTTDAVWYIVQQQTGTNGWQLVGTNTTSTAQTVSNLNCFVTYSFRVAALNSAGTSDWSNIATGRLLVASELIRGADGSVTICWQVAPANVYSIQAAPAMPPVWTTLSTVTVPADWPGNQYCLCDLAAPQFRQRFYRVKWEGPA